MQGENVHRDHLTFIGLDLGQAQDCTGLVVATRFRRGAERNEHRLKPPYDVPYMHRFPHGTPYTSIVPFVVDLLRTAELKGSLLLVDYTGVGQAVNDYFHEHFEGKVTCRYCPVLITNGHTVAPNPGHGYFVPKVELVSALQLAMQTARVRIAPTLPDAALLVKEMQNFRAKVSLAGTDPLTAWREGQHDDLVLALALAVWAGEIALGQEAEEQQRQEYRRVVPEEDERPWWQRR